MISKPAKRLLLSLTTGPVECPTYGSTPWRLMAARLSSAGLIDVTVDDDGRTFATLTTLGASRSPDLTHTAPRGRPLARSGTWADMSPEGRAKIEALWGQPPKV